MPDFVSFDGTRISYEMRGDGTPVVLLHGFASTAAINFDRPGLVDAVLDAGFSTVAPDMRGHGRSDKPHEPPRYEGSAMTRDVVGLLDELHVERCHLVGYSMGAFVTVSVLASDPRPASGVLCGVGENVLRPADRSSHEAIADALEAPDPRAITNRHAKGFRDFADLTGADREALAAMSRSRRDERYEVPDLKAIKTPVLVVVGDRDDLAGSPQGLADRLPDGRAEVVGGTHLNAVNNPAFHRAVVGFLREQEGRAHG